MVQPEGCDEICASYRSRYERERKSRLAAEAIAERGLQELYQKKQLLELVGSIAISANQSSSIEEALQFAIERICETTGWQVAHVYMASAGDPRQLSPTHSWYGADREGIEEFRAQSEAISFDAGKGLPGRVLSTGSPAWIADLARDDNFPRRDAALRCGFTAAFAFPVLAGTEVVAVLEFYADHGVKPDDSFLQLMGQIGAQLGRVVERRRTEEHLVHEAYHDSLTRLPNRALLLDRLAQAMSRHKRHPDSKFAILFVDIDRFKIVNDSLGHSAGDELILQAASRFSQVLREEDVLSRCYECASGERGTLARLGGDEFVVLLEDLKDTVEAAKVAIRLQKSIGAAFFIGGTQLFVSASIGIASSDTPYTFPGDVLRDADLAMYRAKASGKAQYQVFDTRMHEQAMRRLDLESNLRLAMKHREFELYYQPIVHGATGGLHGFEALLRWSRPGFGLVAPGAFIDVAEDTDIIVPLGLWALEEACSTARDWRQQFPAHTGLTMSVNLSLKQFVQPQLALDIYTILEKTGIDPALVKLEITERCTMDDTERAQTVLSQLRALGVQLSIDDFGTGFSSLSYLHRFPFQNLKVDRSFVSRIGSDPESLAIVRTIVRLARDLRLSVTAEGVETELQLERLRHLGCDYAQGYFFAKPLSRQDAENVLRYGLRSPAAFALAEH